MTEEDRERDREQQARRRARLTSPERSVACEHNGRQQQQLRVLQSPQSTAQRRTSDRVRQQQRRASKAAVTDGRVYLGPMTTMCEHCQAPQGVHQLLSQWEGQLASPLAGHIMSTSPDISPWCWMENLWLKSGQSNTNFWTFKLFRVI